MRSKKVSFLVLFSLILVLLFSSCNGEKSEKSVSALGINQKDVKVIKAIDNEENAVAIYDEGQRKYFFSLIEELSWEEIQFEVETEGFENQEVLSAYELAFFEDKNDREKSPDVFQIQGIYFLSDHVMRQNQPGEDSSWYKPSDTGRYEKMLEKLVPFGGYPTAKNIETKKLFDFDSNKISRIEISQIELTDSVYTGNRKIDDRTEIQEIVEKLNDFEYVSSFYYGDTIGGQTKNVFIYTDDMNTDDNPIVISVDSFGLMPNENFTYYISEDKGYYENNWKEEFEK